MKDLTVFLNIRDKNGKVITLSSSSDGMTKARTFSESPRFERWLVIDNSKGYKYDLQGIDRQGFLYGVKCINRGSTNIPVDTVVLVGYYNNNFQSPYIIRSLNTIIPSTELIGQWLTFRQSYGRSSWIAGTIAGSWAVEEDLHPTVIRLADSRWERRGADGLWSAEEPWQLYRDGSAVGESSLLMWHDLSVVDGMSIGLVAEEEGNAWFYDPDYPLPSETNSVTNGAWSTPLPNYEEEDPGGGGDDDDDDDGGILLG